MVVSQSRNVGVYSVEMLNLASWEKRYIIIGSRITMREAVAIGELVKGVTFKVE
jgi:hypothetical protein